MISIDTLQSTLKTDTQALSNSCLAEFAGLLDMNAQAGASPRERLLSFYNENIEPFVNGRKEEAQKLWAKCVERSRAIQKDAAHHAIEIGAAVDFVREVLHQLPKEHFDLGKIHIHALLAFVVIVGRCVKSAPWFDAVNKADSENQSKDES